MRRTSSGQILTLIKGKLMFTIVALAVVLGGFIALNQASAGASVFANTYQISFAATSANPDAAIDASGNLHAVYDRDGNVYYKVNRGAEQLVAAGTDASIAIGSDNVPQVVYLDGGNVKFTKLSGTWTDPETIGAGDWATIGVDSSNKAHVAYSTVGADTYSDVSYANNVSGTFAVPTIILDGQFNVVDYSYTNPVIKIGSNDKYYIAYIETSNGNEIVKIKSNLIGADSVGPIFSSAGLNISKNSLALDSANVPYVVYTTANDSLYYAKITGATFIGMQIGDIDNPANPTEAVIDVNGATVSVACGSAAGLSYSENGAAPILIDADGINPVLAVDTGKSMYYEKSDNIYLTTSKSIDDVTPPVVVGVSEGGIYNTAKTITFSDDATATLDGVPFASGDTVSANGAHTLIVTDGINPAVTINFFIDTAAPHAVIRLYIYADYNLYTDIYDIPNNANGSGIASVQLYVNGTLNQTILPPDSYNPIIVDTSAWADGDYQLEAVVTDAAGNITTSSSYTITLPIPPDTSAPHVVISSVVGNQINTDIYDIPNNSNGSGIASVLLYIDGILTQTIPSTDSYNPIIVDTSVLALGDHEVLVSAVDNAGNWATSSPATLTVTDTVAPTVSITSPADGAYTNDPFVNNLNFTASDDRATNLLWTRYVDGIINGTADNPIISGQSIGTSIMSQPDGAHTIAIVVSDGAGNFATSTITVNIDTVSPIITIGSYTTTSTNQNITVTATTNEGTLNAASHVFTANGSFDFVATDLAGNTTTQTVTISNIDKVAPVITITGANPLNLTVGNTFTDPGATAVDNVDGSVAPTATGTVDNATIGTYTITYTATDAAGNVATTTRTVNVIAQTTGGGGNNGGGLLLPPATTTPTSTDQQVLGVKIYVLDHNFIKVKGQPAVYWLSSDNMRYLFVNRETFSSWFGDDFSGLREISQSEFDGIASGGNLTVKPGSYLKFDNSATVYHIQDGNNIYQATGTPGRIYLIQAGFEGNYNINGLVIDRSSIYSQINSNFIQATGQSGVYWTSSDTKRYLFANRETFSSWFGDDFSGLRNINQSEFDGIASGGNLTVKPGSYLKFDNSNAIYYVKNANNICKATVINMSAKIYLIQAGFEADYTMTGICQ